MTTSWNHRQEYPQMTRIFADSKNGIPVAKVLNRKRFLGYGPSALRSE